MIHVKLVDHSDIYLYVMWYICYMTSHFGGNEVAVERLLNASYSPRNLGLNPEILPDKMAQEMVFFNFLSHHSTASPCSSIINPGSVAHPCQAAHYHSLTLSFRGTCGNVVG